MPKRLKKPQFSISCFPFIPVPCLVRFELHSQALQQLLHSTRPSWQVLAATEESCGLLLQFQTTLCSHLVACSIFYTSACQTGYVFSLHSILKCYPGSECYFRKTAHQFLFINISYQWMLAKITRWGILQFFPSEGPYSNPHNSIWNTSIKSNRTSV